MKEDKLEPSEAKSPIIEIIGVVAIVCICLSLLIAFVLNLNTLDSVLVSMVIVGVIIGINMEKILITPEPNTGVILKNYFRKDESSNIKKKEDIKRPRGQRVVFSGYNLKWPWEEPFGEPISLNKIVPLGTTVKLQVGGVQMEIEWLAGLFPIPSQDLVMYPLFPEHEIVALRTAEIEGEIQRLASVDGVTSEKVRENPKEFFKDLPTNLYGGEIFIREERDTGRHVANFRVSSADKSKTSASADEGEKNADKIAGIIRKISEASGGDSIVTQMGVGVALGKSTSGDIVQFTNQSGKKK